MSIQINTEYFRNCCYVVPKDQFRKNLQYVYIYDDNNKRFYVATDCFALIEFNEEIIGNKLPDDGILLKKPNISDLKKIKNSHFELTLATNLKYGEEKEILTQQNKLKITIYNFRFPNYKGIMPSESNAINYKYDENIFDIIDPKYIKIFIEKLGIKKENILKIPENHNKTGIFYQSEHIRVIAMEFVNQK